MKVSVLPTAPELAQAVAEHFTRVANECIAEHGRFTVALTGGTTPKEAYALIASPAFAAKIDWTHVHVFWGDERCVPPTDPASNYGMARSVLLDHVPIPPENVHRMRGEDEPETAAAAYERLIDAIVGDRFDLVHLGMGADAHIASLFPGSPVLRETKRRIRALYVEAVGMWRITMTPVVINRARSITFIVAGAEKADAVARVLQGPRDPDHTPAQVVAPDRGHLLWLLDAAAASRLDTAPDE